MNLNKTLYQTIKKVAKENPTNIAYDFLGFRRSYSDFLEDIDRSASFLYELGIKEGDIISIYLPNIPQALELFFAINKIGAISNFIHPQMPIESNKQILEKMNPKAVFLLDSMHEKLRTLRDNSIADCYVIVRVSDYLPTWMKLFYKIREFYYASKIKLAADAKYYVLNEQSNNFSKSINPEDTATILFTGGTTGDPKGVCLSNFNINAAAYQTSSYRTQAQPGDKMLAILPIFHGYGLANCIYTALIEGGEVILLPYFSEKLFKKTIISKKPNYILGVPILFSKLMELFSSEDINLSFFKGLYCGGSKLSEDLLDQFNDFLSVKGAQVLLREGYGLTECVGACSLMPEKSRKKNSVGHPYEGVRIKITDIETHKELDANDIGRICIKSDTIMTGYYKEEAHNIRVECDERWLYTDDVGYLDKDGYLFYTDRLSRKVKILGYEVYPANIESIINKIDYVSDSCVVESNDQHITSLKAYIVLVSNHKVSKKRKHIMDSLKKDLPKWSIPREIIFINKIPETLLKKKDYKRLK
jgi:long-chain acyl-CoA synthetase